MEVLVNAAMSADGKLSTRRRDRLPISGEDDFARVDELRRTVDAIVVGRQTRDSDDPSLTVSRTTDGGPARVVLDSDARTPTDARVFRGAPETIILTTGNAPPERVASLRDAGATVLARGEDSVDIAAGFTALGERGIERILVEGGGEVIFSCFAADLVDELRVFIGPLIIGGKAAPTLADGDGFLDRDEFPELTLHSVAEIDDGLVVRWQVA